VMWSLEAGAYRPMGLAIQLERWCLEACAFHPREQAIRWEM